MSNKMKFLKSKKIFVILIAGLLVFSGVVFAGIKVIQNRNEINACMIQFDSSGGTEINPQKIRKGSKIKQPENPIKDGFTFIEWQLDGKTYDFNSPVKDNIILTAKWEANPETEICIVSFDSDGGSQVNEIEVSKGQTITPPINPKKSGYSFMGWYYNNTLFDFNYAVMEDMTLVAKWEEGENKDIDLNSGNIVKTNNSNVSDNNVDSIISTMLGNWYWENDGEVRFSTRYTYVNGNECVYFEWYNININEPLVYSSNSGGSSIIFKPIQMESLQTFLNHSNIKSINNDYFMIGQYKFIRNKKSIDLNQYNDYIGTWYLIGDRNDSIIINKDSDTYFEIAFTVSGENYKEEITQKKINEKQTIFDKNGISYNGNKLIVNRNGNTKIYSKNKSEAKIALKDINIICNKNSNELHIGETIQCSIVPTPQDATDITGTWYSSNPSIATVDNNGLVTGVSEGWTDISFTSNDGNIMKLMSLYVSAIKVQKINLEQTNYILTVGDKQNLNYTITPNNATNKNVEYTVSVGDIINIESGCIVAKNVGTVTLTIDSEDRNATVQCTITVLPKAVEGISISKSSETIYINETTSLSATVVPSNATNKNIIWTSSNSEIASVNSYGTVTGKGAGTAIITAKTEDGGYTASCNVTVNIPPLTLDGSIGFTTRVTNNSVSTGMVVTAKPSGGTGIYTYNIKLYYEGNLIGEGTSKELFVSQYSNGTYSATITVTDSNGDTKTITKTITKS